MSTERKVVHFGQSTAGVKESALYVRFRELADERLLAMLRHMLDQTDDALFDRAEKAGSNQEQQTFFDAMREIRRARRDLEERFQGGIAVGHRGGSMPGRHAPDGNDQEPELDGLSLMDNEALEEHLAIDGMISKARSRLKIPLDALCQRLDADAGRTWATEQTNPVDPARVCAALEEAAGVLDIELQPRLILYKLFDRYVVSQLEGFYQELNQLFIDAGVLPKVRPRGKAGQQTGSSQRPPAPHAGGDDAGEQGPYQGLGGSAGSYAGSHQPPQSAEDAFAVLQNLLAAQRQPTEWSGTGYSAPGQTAAVEDLLQALSGLQMAPAPVPGSGHAKVVPLKPGVIKQQLRQQLSVSGHAEADLGQAEDDTIDIVSMLFDAVLEDPNLPDSIKALLARLQIPVVKVALLDRAFFSQKSHPARRLINEVARAGVGWTDSGSRSGDPLYQAIERIVTHVLEEFSDDVSVFGSALDEFHQFLEDDRARTEQIEERTRQAAEGKARVDGAKEQVDVAIRERVGSRQLPECAHRLLYEGWSQVLFITLLREGEDSDAWRHRLDVVDRLLWSLEPKTDHAARKQLVTEIPPLLNDLRSELNAVMFNPIEMTKLFKALEHEHIRSLSREPEKPPETDETPRSEAPVAADDAGVVDTDEAEQEDDELESYRERLDQVAVGTWFEFRQDNGKHLRAKLSARLNGGDRLIFVNRAGFKLADRRRGELADALRQETVLMLDDNMLFDKALENVVSNLRSMRETS